MLDRRLLPMWTGAAVLGVLFLYFYLAPSQAFARGHDFLDHVFAFYVVWARQSHSIGDFSAIVNELAGGLPLNSLALSDFGLGQNLYRLLSPFTAFAVNEVLRRSLAFIGLYLLLRDYLLGDTQRDLWIASLVALGFALLPDQANRFGTIMLTPLLAWSVLNLHLGRTIVVSWVAVLFYPFYSVLFLGGWVVCGYIALGVVAAHFAHASSRWRLTFVLVVMSAAYVFIEIRMFYQWFVADYVSYRHLVEFPPPSFTGVLQQFVSEFFLGNNANNVTRHSPVIFAVVLGTAVVLPVVRRVKFHPRPDDDAAPVSRMWSLFWLLLLLVAANALINALDQSGFLDFKYAIGFPFSFHRADLTSPLIWRLLLAISIWVWLESVGRIGRNIVAATFVLVVLYSVVQFPGVKEEARRALGISQEGGFVQALVGQARENRPFRTVKQDYHAGHTRLGEYYRPDDYREVKMVLEPLLGPPSSYQTMSFGIPPSVAQFNGFHTLDGLYYDVPAAYAAHFIETFVAPELARDGIEPPLSTGGLVLGVSSKTLRNDIAEPVLDVCSFREMGGRVLFSRWRLANAEQLGLLLVLQKAELFTYVVDTPSCPA